MPDLVRRPRPFALYRLRGALSRGAFVRATRNNRGQIDAALLDPFAITIARDTGPNLRAALFYLNWNARISELGEGQTPNLQPANIETPVDPWLQPGRSLILWCDRTNCICHLMRPDAIAGYGSAPRLWEAIELAAISAMLE